MGDHVVKRKQSPGNAESFRTCVVYVRRKTDTQHPRNTPTSRTCVFRALPDETPTWTGHRMLTRSSAEQGYGNIVSDGSEETSTSTSTTLPLLAGALPSPSRGGGAEDAAAAAVPGSAGSAGSARKNHGSLRGGGGGGSAMRRPS